MLFLSYNLKLQNQQLLARETVVRVWNYNIYTFVYGKRVYSKRVVLSTDNNLLISNK